MRSIGVLVLAIALGLASPASAGEPLATDSAFATASGATFTAPTGWRVATAGNTSLVEPPETDSRVALVDVLAANADAAVAAGWAAYRPDANRPLRLATPQAPYNGWEERRLFQYETSPNEKAVVYAQAWRAGRAWTVVIVDASRATFEKRYAGFSLITASLRPKGYKREQFADRKAHPLDAERIAVLKDFVQDVMKQLDIPGVGLSLIEGRQVVFAGGFGVKTVGKPDPVDADTLFLAASNTKAMTTLLLAELVDEGKMRWDQPVTELYPPFRLGNAETTRQVLVKHLVCACTGLPRQDAEWLFNFGGATPLSSLASLATMQPTSRFGEAYQYSNPMAAAAGYVGAHVVDSKRELGAAYDEAMRSKVFGPLGMTTTTFDFAKVLVGNMASPHDLDFGDRTMPASMDINYSIVPVRPAGGMWTSARELARYLQMELALGKLPDGTQLVSKESLLERRRPQIRTGEDQAYGMGLWINTQYGIPIVSHGGSMFGYKSDMLFLPDHGVGAVILTNSNSGGNLTWLLRRRLLELLFDGKPEAVEQARVATEQRRANRAKWRERLVVPPVPAEAEKLAPRYASPALGTLTVRKQDGATIFDFGPWRSAVASRKNDDGTTSFITIDPTVGGFTFVVGERDGKRALVFRDNQHEYPLIESPAP